MNQENDCAHEDVPVALPVGALEVATLLSDERREELKGVLTVDSGKVGSHLAGKVRQAVEDVLNGLLDAEADERRGRHEMETANAERKANRPFSPRLRVWGVGITRFGEL